jgi:hypothetical protein
VHHAHAAELLASVCARYDLKNLDVHPEFVGKAKVNTTCEVLAQAVWRGVAEGLLLASTKGEPAAAAAAASAAASAVANGASVKVVVHESDVALVQYEQCLAAHAAFAGAARAAEAAAHAEASADATTAAAACAAAAAANVGSSSSGSGGSSTASTAAAQDTASSLAAHAAASSRGASAAAQASVDAAFEAQRLKAGECWRVAVRARAMVARSLPGVANGGVHGDAHVASLF